MKTAVIIGAGITGLAAAATLKKAGWAVRLLEKSGQPGGAIRTIRRDGYTVEAGPNSMMVGGLKTSLLLGEWGLADELLLPEPAAKSRFIWKNGEMVPVPIGPNKFMKSTLLSGGGKLRLLKEPFVKKPDNLAEESLSNLILRRMGQEVLDFVAEPLVSGIFAGDPKRLSAQHAFPQIAAMEDEHGSLIKGMMKRPKAPGSHKSVMVSFQSGMQAVTDALAAKLGDDLVCGATTTAITRDGRWNVSWEANGQPDSISADALIVAIPAFAVRDLPLPREVHDALYDLHEIPYPPLTSFSLGYKREQIDHDLDGFGVLVPGVEGRKVLGVLFPSSIFSGRAPDGHALLTVFLGGMRQRELATLPENEQLDLIKAELAEIVGASGEPVFTERTLWEKAIPQYNVGHGDFLKMIERAETAAPGLHLCGNYRGGIAVGQCLSNGVELGKKIAG